MIPQFDNRADLHKWLHENKSLVMQAKKAAVKYADAVGCVSVGPSGVIGADVQKELGEVNEPKNGILYGKVVINTTNLMDSHSDVHIPGLWKKSISETKDLYLLQEHQMSFDKVIADDVTAYTKTISWKSLGYDMPGNTQALVFDATIKADRNAMMYDQYAKGYVRNHSVGMRYVKMLFCVDSDEKYMAEEKANWDKYIDQVSNKEAAEAQGYFFAVTEAKVIEGSAVLVGSNRATPTLEITGAGKSTPPINTNDEPEQSTHDYSFLKTFSIKN